MNSSRKYIQAASCLKLWLVWAIIAMPGLAGAADGNSFRFTLDESIPVVDQPLLRHPCEFTATWSQGQLSAAPLATARTYNAGTHRVNIIEQSITDDAAGALPRRLALTIQIDFGADHWIPAAQGRYQLEIDLIALNGSFQGEVTLGDHHLSTAGQVAIAPIAPWPGIIADHQPIAAGEHPRLTMRANEVATWQQRASQGKEQQVAGRELAEIALQKLMAGLADRRRAALSRDQFATYEAAIAGWTYLLSGEQRFADAAAERIQQVVFGEAAALAQQHIKQDIHYAPFLMGLAFAYDSCYHAWEPAFRDACGREIAKRTLECYQGTVDGKLMEGINLYVWSNHNAIRVSCMALGAMAILGDGHADDTQLRRIIDRAAIDMRDYFYTGIADSGIGMEGHYYKSMTLDRGLMQGILAYRLVLGQDIISGPLADFVVAGEFHHVGLAGEFHHGGLAGERTRAAAAFWPSLFLSGRSDLMPYYLYQWQQNEIFHDVTALHCLVAHDLASKMQRQETETAPAGLFDHRYPWWLAGGAKGVELFRYLGPGQEDVRIILNNKSDIRDKCHYERAGDWPSLDIFAFDQWWTAGRFLPTVHSDYATFNPHLGPIVTNRTEPLSQVAILQLDLKRCFYEMLNPTDVSRRISDGARKGTAYQTVSLANWKRVAIDHGIRGSRSILIDTSGACGAPALVVWLDQLAHLPASKQAAAIDEEKLARMPPMIKKKYLANLAASAKPPSSLSFPIPRELGSTVSQDNNRLIIGSEQAAHLAAQSFSGDWQDGRLTNHDHRYLVACTIQQGPAPIMILTKHDDGQLLTIGERQILIAGNDLQLVK